MTRILPFLGTDELIAHSIAAVPLPVIRHTECCGLPRKMRRSLEDSETSSSEKLLSRWQDVVMDHRRLDPGGGVDRPRVEQRVARVCLGLEDRVDLLGDHVGLRPPGPDLSPRPGLGALVGDDSALVVEQRRETVGQLGVVERLERVEHGRGDQRVAGEQRVVARQVAAERGDFGRPPASEADPADIPSSVGVGVGNESRV